MATENNSGAAASGSQPAATSTAKTSATAAEVPTNDLAAIIFGQQSKRKPADEDPPASEDASEDEDSETPDPQGETETGEAGEEGEGADDPAAEEAAAESDEEPAGEGDETPSAEDQTDEETKKIRARFSPEQQKLFDKAVAKKTRRIIELRSQLQERETALEQAAAQAKQTPPPAPTADQPLSDVEDEAGLAKFVAQQRALRRWALSHPRGGQVAQGAEIIEISEDQVGRILADTEEALGEHVPRRAAFIRAKADWASEAVKAYPALKSKTSPESIQVENLLRIIPALRHAAPDARLIAADILAGMGLRLAAAAKAGKSAVGSSKVASKTPSKAPATPAGGARPAKTSGSAKAATGALKALESTGDDPGNAALSALLTG